jgi:Amt family ammonium transporter
MTISNVSKVLGLAALAALVALPVLGQDAPAPEVVATVDKGDTTWMLVSTILVIAMTIPGLALFYGGLVRS